MHPRLRLFELIVRTPGLLWLASCALACSESERFAPAPTDGDGTITRNDAGHFLAGDPAPADAGACVQMPGDGGACYQTRSLRRAYQGICEPEARVQWGFLVYEAFTPGDSNIAFRIRTAATEAGLAGLPWIELITAQAQPDTQVCGFGGPPPCPVDLYAKLGGAPAAHHDFAELELIINPTSDGRQQATVERWQIDYSCPFN